MPLPKNINGLLETLPDPEAAERFFHQLTEETPKEARKLGRNPTLLSDILTLVSFSPLLATTLLQNPEYITWLKGRRVSIKVAGKEEILESLARFALVNSKVEPNILLARFRRRELLRIYLRDIRNLGTIAEITEEISNLADAILEYALGIARQKLENRFGIPLETDEKKRAKQAEFCIVALGKLGSRELNYSSDIDLLFLYSHEGSTSGQNAKGTITNREYFVKLAEMIVKLVGDQSGEGAAYRVDLRLRPNGRVGALAISLDEAVRYYRQTARSWEKQVLIRSRACAGNTGVFQEFFKQVESEVFSPEETVEKALRNVRLSKEKIDLEKDESRGFDVKLGKGGIREIEFIAQALQLAYGGNDEWLRAPHTLISLSRLGDRQLLSETELTQLFEAYSFLRRLEHRLQMENGLQTHLVPSNLEKQLPIAQQMGLYFVADFQKFLEDHTRNVREIFTRIFGDATAEPKIHTENIDHQLNQIDPDEVPTEIEPEIEELKNEIAESKAFSGIISSLEKSEIKIKLDKEKLESLKRFCDVTPNFAGFLSSNPQLIKSFPNFEADFSEKDYRELLLRAVEAENNFAGELSVLRKNWSEFILEIGAFDVFGKLRRPMTKILQTWLAEASIETALFITRRELERRFSVSIEQFPFAVLGLGKLGGGGMDYGSDLDLVLIFDEQTPLPVGDISHSEFYVRGVEIFVTTLSSLTRDGLLYRVDLRLRPDGKNGPPAIGKKAFLNYLEIRSAIWEWLAYVKLRGVAGDLNLALATEHQARKIIHDNARKADIDEIRKETCRVRNRLEQEKSSRRKGKEIDIKFGEGGMLDVYFALRFLQLKDYVPDDGENRSTIFTLKKLCENQSLTERDYQNFSEGYKFLTELDHNLRLSIGRSTRLPLGNKKTLEKIADRMKLGSTANMLEQLHLHRLNIRESFERVLTNGV
ncbi:MAG: hypothetical protein R2747_06280 [Pyrinomonadaceae bacterium]